MELKFKIFENKRNNQLSISIPRREFHSLKGKNPKFLKVKGDLEFLE